MQHRSLQWFWIKLFTAALLLSLFLLIAVPQAHGESSDAVLFRFRQDVFKPAPSIVSLAPEALRTKERKLRRVIKIHASHRAARIEKLFLRAELITKNRGTGMLRRTARMKTAADPVAFCKSLLATGRVDYCHPDYPLSLDALPNDTYVDAAQDGVWDRGALSGAYENQWGLKNSRAVEAWNSPACAGACRGEGVTVAVIDSGVDATHLDLQGRVDTEHAQDFATNGTATAGQDKVGHGTHVAGIIAANANNVQGIAGVAPAVQILPLKAFDDSGKGSTSAAAQAVAYAVALTSGQGRLVVNASWGYQDRYQPWSAGALIDVVREAVGAGAVFVISAGNNNQDLVAPNAPLIPQLLDEVITVGGIAPDEKRWVDSATVGSNYGAVVDLAAPAFDTLSTRSSVAAKLNETRKIGNAYYRWNGTSFAAPHVAGAAAILLSRAGNLTPAKVRDLLVSSGRNIAAPDSLRPIGKILDVKAALDDLAQELVPPTATPTPTATSTWTATSTPTHTPQHTATPTLTNGPEESPIPSPTPTVVFTPTVQPTSTPTIDPTPTSTPTATPTSTPISDMIVVGSQGEFGVFSSAGVFTRFGGIPNSSVSGQESAQTMDLAALNGHSNIAAFKSAEASSLAILQMGDTPWSYLAYPGWSMRDARAWGGLAQWGDYLFATDSGTDGRGLMRFNLNTQATTWFALPFDFLDAAAASNAILALTSERNVVRTIDPLRGTGRLTEGQPVVGKVLGTVILDKPIDFIAADCSGRIFGADRAGSIYRFDGWGRIEKELTIPGISISDLKSRADGTLALGLSTGSVTILTGELQYKETRVSDISGPVSVAWYDLGLLESGDPFVRPECVGPAITNHLVFPVSSVVADNQHPNYPATNLVDNNPGKLWAMLHRPEDPQKLLPVNVTFDLGGVRPLSYMEIDWTVYNGQVTNYDIEVSNDGTVFTPTHTHLAQLDTTAAHVLGTSAIVFGNQSARYVRISLKTCSTGDWCAISDVRFFAQ